LHAMQALSQLS